MTLDVHRNYILVKPIIEETKLILPPMFKAKMDTVKRGIVRACGPQSHVNVGETIVFDKWQDNTILINGEQVFIIQPNSVIAVES